MVQIHLRPGKPFLLVWHDLFSPKFGPHPRGAGRGTRCTTIAVSYFLTFSSGLVNFDRQSARR